MTAETLRLQVSTAKGWQTIAARALSARGYAMFTVRPVRSSTYRMLFTETDRLVGSRSAARRIDVRTAAVAPVPRTSGGSTAVAAPSGAAPASSRVARVLAVAAAQTGKWYRYGAAGPNYFDCSGFTQYVFKHVGIYLPHKANSQKYYGRAVSRSAARPGDLVVFLSGGYGYHVGIYAGGGYMYDAPYSGKQVGKRKIWGTNVIFRRLL